MHSALCTPHSAPYVHFGNRDDTGLFVVCEKELKYSRELPILFMGNFRQGEMII